MKLPRSSGILLHPTSLPGPHGIGDLGPEAYRFVDWLAAAGQSVWQILPLGPTGFGDSPYSAFSAFAGNPLLVSLERLVEAGDLEPSDIAGIDMPEGEAHFGYVQGCKGRLLHRAALRFRASASPERQEGFERFCAAQATWLPDYALFQALRRHLGEGPWQGWPAEIRRREPAALRHLGAELAEGVFQQQYAQFAFFEQWLALKDYANGLGISLFGDIPIFVALDSAEVWAHPELFHLDPQGQPTQVAGVPPDYFSATGQLWGNPLYRWEALAKDGYAWWLNRIRWNLTLADLVRIDHFRGFEACWAIPAGETTAVNGRWIPVPGAELLAALQRMIPEAPLVAEDLGVITPEVEALRERFALPGMKILHFAFDSGPDNPYLPHNLPRRCVVYTGTHDNDTTLGWWEGLDRPARDSIRAYLGTPGGDIPWELNRAALSTVADLCILPLQDVLGLGGGARMNLPGRPGGNWGWRFLPGALTGELAAKLSAMVHRYGRSPSR